jgi:hypothetical protein
VKSARIAVAACLITLAVVALLEDAVLRHYRDLECVPAQSRYVMSSCMLLDDETIHLQVYGYRDGKPFRFRRVKP